VRYRDPQVPLQLDGTPGVCLERIRDVVVKGKEGEEKVFVGIERRIGRGFLQEEPLERIEERLWRDSNEDFGDAEIIERRNIVFMRERTPEEMKAVFDTLKGPRNERVKKSRGMSLMGFDEMAFNHD